MPPSPAARKALAESQIEVGDVEAPASRAGPQAGRGGRHRQARSGAAAAKHAGLLRAGTDADREASNCASSAPPDAEREERVKMTRLRQTIARRLKDAQNTAAMLTTFNDVDMSAVMAMRSQYKDLFEKRHGVRLGFMGFFVKACLTRLKEIPAVNAEIDGTDIVYKNYYHIGVAVGTEKGLVVPVVRDADRMTSPRSRAKSASSAAARATASSATTGAARSRSRTAASTARSSTPILNAPQSGILGMHRAGAPVVRNGQIVVRPMMYLALSYDHRIVDGKEAVTFLVRVKECLEDPHRFVLEL